VAEFSGLAQTGGQPATDQTANNHNASGGSVTVATTTNSAAGDLAFSAYGNTASVLTSSIGNPDAESGGTWTALTYIAEGIGAAYQVGGAASLYSAAWSSSGSPTNSDACLVTYKASPVVTTSSLPAGNEGTPYSQTLAAEWGIGGYTWSVTSGVLPPGLSLAGSTGIISGTPTIAGSSSFTVTVTDAHGNVGTQALAIAVASNLTVTTTSLPTATLTVAYAETLAATGGTGPYAWSIISSGSFAPGLSFSSAGQITGTPSAVGSWTFTAEVTDSLSNTATQSLVLTVTPPTPPALYLPNNLLSNQDSDFEGSGGTWTAEVSAGAPVPAAGDSVTGEQCLQWLSNVASGTTGPTQVHSGLYPALALKPYIASLWLKADSFSDCYIGLEWYNSTGTLISTSTGGDNPCVPGIWQPMTIATAAPAGATQVSLFVQVADSSQGDIEKIDTCYIAQTGTQVLVDWFNPTFAASSQAGEDFMDVSCFVRMDAGITINGGRQDAISETQPGSMTFALQNDSGVFTQDNLFSPIVINGGTVDLQRRIQINYADEQANWWTRADGPVSELDYAGDSTGNTNQCSVSGTDILAELNREDVMQCWTRERVFQDGPAYHWSLNDEGNNVGAGVAAESSGNNGPPMRIFQGGSLTGAALTWQDSSGGVETLADAVAAGQPDGSEYWLAGQIQPTSLTRGLDAGTQGTYTVALPGLGLGDYTTPSIPIPSVTLTPDLTAQGSQNQFLGNGGYYLQTQLPNPIAPSGGNDYAIEMWFTMDPAVGEHSSSQYGPYIALSLGNSQNQDCIAAGIYLPTSFKIAYYDNPPAWAGRNFSTTSAPSPTASLSEAITLDSARLPHHLVLNIHSNATVGTVTAFLDGQQIGTSFTLAAGEQFDTITVGAAYGSGGGWYGNLSLVSIYEFRMPQSMINTHCQFGQYGMWECPTDDCIAQLGQFSLMPPFWNNLTAQHSALSLTDYYNISGTNALDNMQLYEQTEMGLLFVNRQGGLTYHTRDWRMGYGAPDLMLPPGSFDAAMGEQVVDQYQCNEQAVNTNSFSAGTAYTNQSSQDQYGAYVTDGPASPLTLPLITWARAFAEVGVNGYGLWSDPCLTDYCAWLANSRSTSYMLPGSLTVDVLTIGNDPEIDLVPSQLFALEIDNMIAPTGVMPQSFPNQTGVSEWFIEGINETKSNTQHTIQFYCSPAAYQRAWIPGSATYGQLDATARIGISAADLSITQADGKDVSHDAGGPYWTPTFDTPLNNPSNNGHSFIGMTEMRGLVSNLQNALQPPISAVGAVSTSQTIGNGPVTAPQVLWDQLYVDTASGMGVMPGWPNWYVCVLPGWYEIDAQLVYELDNTSGGFGMAGWLIVAQAAAQAVTGGTGTPLTVGQYVCPIGEIQRRNTASANTICAPSTRMYLGLGDMVTLGAQQDSGAPWSTGTDFMGSYMSLRYIGMGTQDDRTQVNTSVATGGSVVTPAVITRSSASFQNTGTYSYYGATSTSNPYGLRNTNGNVYQGSPSNQWATIGSQFAQIVFNVSAIRTALSGMTIDGLTLECQCIGAWYPTGAKLMVGYFEDSPGGATWTPGDNAGNIRNIVSEDFRRNQTKTFSLPLQVATSLLGSANGLWVGDDNTSNLNNTGIWAGGADAWTLTFRYHS
jgi:hypothetical protein